MNQRYMGWRAATLVVGCALGTLLATAPARAQECVGDCNGDGEVTINELILGVNIALGALPVSACPAFENQQGQVDIAQLIKGVNNALNGCPAVNTPTDTVPADTPTSTPTLPAGTATATITDTPQSESTATPTATPTATAEPTGEALGSHVCDLGTGSKLFLQSAAVPFNLDATGTFTIDCGAPGAAGIAECACTLDKFNPVVIPSIGDVCVNPASGCEPGRVACDGVAPLDVDLVGDHNIGACTSNAECAASCDAHCATLGEHSVRQSYGCEGYCLGGSNDGAECTRDSQCPGGQCPGGEPVTHFDICNCVCSGTDLGGASAAGGMACNLGTQINVELPSNGKCGEPATIELAPVCGNLTTETSTGVILHANNSATATIPPAGPESVDGAPISCDAFKAGTLAGLKMVGQLAFFDSTLGDIRSRNTFVCK